MGKKKELFEKANVSEVFKCFIEKDDEHILTHKQVMDKTKLQREQVTRALKELIKVDYLKKEDKYYILNTKMDFSNFNPIAETPEQMFKKNTPEKTEYDIGSLAKFTDLTWIKEYPKELIIHRPYATIYGLREDKFDNQKNNWNNFCKLHYQIAPEDIFKKKGRKLGATEIIKNLIDKLLEIKREETEKAIEEELKALLRMQRFQKLKPLILNNIDFWKSHFSRTDVTPRMMRDLHFFDAGGRGGFKKLNYSKKEDVELVRTLVPNSEKRKSIKYLKEKYQVAFPAQGGGFIKYEFFEQLKKTPEEDREVFYELVEKLFDYLMKERYYPSRVSIAGQSVRVVFDPNH